MQIVIAPNQTLSTTSVELNAEDIADRKRLEKLTDEMLELMYATDGCGLAAPQIGLNQRLVVIDCDQDDETPGPVNPQVLINPVIDEFGNETSELWEGCLSVPGIRVKLERPTTVKAHWTNLDGEVVSVDADGLLARCLQHEIDHLDGKTMLENLRGRRKLEALAKYSAALKSGAAEDRKIRYEIK